MKNLLSEELERYKQLSNYNTKLTLVENTEVILEQPSIATTMKELESALGKNIGQIMKEFKIASMDAARVTKLLEMDAKTLEKEWAKTLQADIKSGFPKGELGPLGKELSKVEFLRRLSNEVKGQGRVLKPSELETLIKDVKSDIKSKSALRAAKFNPRVVNTKVKPVDPKIIEDTVIKYPYLKNLDWKSLLKKGGVLLLSTAVLYGIYKLTHDDEPPLPPDPNPDPNPDPTPTPGKCPAVTNTGVSYDYQYPGDTKYVYGIKNKEWYAKNVSTGKEFNISKCYPDMVKKLNTGVKKINTPTPTPTPEPSPSPDDTIDNSQDLVSDEGI